MRKLETNPNLVVIENKKTKVVKKNDGNGKVEYLNYADLINICASSTDPQKGCSIAEQRIRIRLMFASEEANGQIKIDKMWLPMLKKLVEETQWNIVHADLVKFADDIEEIKQP